MDVIEGLRYIADSPPREHGGFHPNAVQAARDAIAEIARLREQRDYYMARSARRGRAIGGLLSTLRHYHKVQFGFDPFSDGARARRAFVRRVLKGGE